MESALTRAINLIEESVVQFVANLPGVVIALITFYIIYRLSQPLSNLVKSGLQRTDRSDSLQIVLTRLTRWLIIFFGFLLAATIALPNFTPSQLISFLGISGVAIGFAFRDVLQNFLAGILILVTEPFKINDQIVFGDYEGTVEDIQIRATNIRTYDNRRVLIPNGELFTNSVTVNTAYNIRRSQYGVGIGYEDDIEEAQSLCLEVVRSVDGVLDEPAPNTVMTEMADSAIVFLVRWWTSPRQADVLKVQNEVLRRVKNRLTEEGFNIPFPIRTVYFNDETDQASEK